ncbi:sarcosine oxidase, subunit gamma [Tianweitania sp. BSSL-BM11]|uniref:Sarcosine oxidase, subunit gamma n=2 Tax=Tianweitania aestuarii TaxID=2814886 RepID=A0ABS5RWQ3_9HYPH|nr:sarcosine oxidase, subunit gamma [Tianweitania aestuarii]
MPEGTLLEVRGPQAELPALEAAADAAGLVIRTNGPDQWFAISGQPMLRLDLPDIFSVTDQSHGRVRIAMEGAAVDDVLAKGMAVDLFDFKIGAATTALIGHITTHIARLDRDRFELTVLRSFAESLWHDLETMSAEFLDR